MNKKSFSYTSRYGTEFNCARCDFRVPIKITNRPHKKLEDWFLSDLAEMIGYHAVNIRPELNGFQGYDCLKFF